MAAVLVFAAFAAGEARAENVDLTVDVSGLRNYKGRVVLMLWADSEHNSSFPDPSRVQFRDERQETLLATLHKRRSAGERSRAFKT